MLQYILPPVLGAVIGYITNFIAIRMLFRPLREFRVLGIRMPLTPGIIPKQRYQLAESIGRMVSRQLLTEETMRAHIESDSFRRGLRNGISNVTDDLLTRRVRVEPSSELAGLIEGLTREVLGRFLRSDRFKGAVETVIERVIGRVQDKRLGEILAERERLKEQVAGIMERLAGGERLRHFIVESGDRFVARHYNRNTPLGRVLTDNVLSEVARFLTGAYDPALRSLLNWLRTDEMRSELAVRGKFILRDILDKLNMWQRLFVSAAQYDTQLSNRMPEIVDDLLDTLEEAGNDTKNKERVINAVLKVLRNLQSQGLADVAMATGIDVQSRAHDIFERLATTLEGDSVRQRITERVTDWVEERRDDSVGALVSSTFSVDSSEIVGWTQRTAIEWLEREAVISGIQDEVVALVRRTVTADADSSLGELLALSEDRKAEVTELVARNVESFIDRKLPDIVEAIDIHTLVVNRINSLDVSQVEKLLLTVIARHLKWINLFGALLGALIGGSQVLVNLFW